MIDLERFIFERLRGISDLATIDAYDQGRSNGLVEGYVDVLEYLATQRVSDSELEEKFKAAQEEISEILYTSRGFNPLDVHETPCETTVLDEDENPCDTGDVEDDYRLEVIDVASLRAGDEWDFHQAGVFTEKYDWKTVHNIEYFDRNPSGFNIFPDEDRPVFYPIRGHGLVVRRVKKTQAEKPSVATTFDSKDSPVTTNADENDDAARDLEKACRTEDVDDEVKDVEKDYDIEFINVGRLREGDIWDFHLAEDPAKQAWKRVYKMVYRPLTFGFNIFTNITLSISYPIQGYCSVVRKVEKEKSEKPCETEVVRISDLERGDDWTYYYEEYADDDESVWNWRSVFKVDYDVEKNSWSIYPYDNSGEPYVFATNGLVRRKVR